MRQMVWRVIAVVVLGLGVAGGQTRALRLSKLWVQQDVPDGPGPGMVLRGEVMAAGFQGQPIEFLTWVTLPDGNVSTGRLSGTVGHDPAQWVPAMFIGYSNAVLPEQAVHIAAEVRCGGYTARNEMTTGMGGGSDRRLVRALRLMGTRVARYVAPQAQGMYAGSGLVNPTPVSPEPMAIGQVEADGLEGAVLTVSARVKRLGGGEGVMANQRQETVAGPSVGWKELGLTVPQRAMQGGGEWVLAYEVAAGPLRAYAEEQLGVWREERPLDLKELASAFLAAARRGDRAAVESMATRGLAARLQTVAPTGGVRQTVKRSATEGDRGWVQVLLQNPASREIGGEVMVTLRFVREAGIWKVSEMDVEPYLPELNLEEEVR